MTWLLGCIGDYCQLCVLDDFRAAGLVDVLYYAELFFVRRTLGKGASDGT